MLVFPMVDTSNCGKFSPTNRTRVNDSTIMALIPMFGQIGQHENKYKNTGAINKCFQQ